MEDEFAKIDDIREDWQKSAFLVPWTDSPEVMRPGLGLCFHLARASVTMLMAAECVSPG